jgi:hypothetical protein
LEVKVGVDNSSDTNSLDYKIRNIPLSNLITTGYTKGDLVFFNGSSWTNTNTKNISPFNLLKNGSFESWSQGTSSAPDGWSLSGAGATIAKETTIYKISYTSAKITRSGNDVRLYQRVIPSNHLIGRKVTLGCWVNATVANGVRISIEDRGEEDFIIQTTIQVEEIGNF